MSLDNWFNSESSVRFKTPISYTHIPQMFKIKQQQNKTEQNKTTILSPQNTNEEIEASWGVFDNKQVPLLLFSFSESC